MRWIRPSSRDRFTGHDFHFIIETLSVEKRDRSALESLLADPDTRDQVLDHPRLVDVLGDCPSFLKISPQCFFYLQIRRALKDAGLDDVEMADYLAGLCEAFIRQISESGSETGAPLSPCGLPYLSDILVQLAEAGPTERFFLRARVGDTTLFISGLFESRILAMRERRGGPDLSFYEEIGRSHYHYAARDRRARDLAADQLFDQLACSFSDVRLALRSLSERVFHLSQADADAAKLIS